MAFQVSPGVLVQEIDATNVIPAVSSSTAGYVGHFLWGPVDEVRTVASPQDLVDIFGKPENTNVGAEYFFPAIGYLSAGLDLKVVRCQTSTAQLNAVSGDGVGVLIKNTAHYTNSYRAGEGSGNTWAARYAGAKGNNLKISTCGGVASFSKVAATTTDGVAVKGATTLDVASGAAFIVGDVITAIDPGGADEDLTRYSITAISSNELTIEQETDSTQGLNIASADANNITREWEHAQHFNGAPGTSAYAAGRSSAGSKDEMHIIVIDEDGDLSGVVGTILEKFEAVSKASDAKDEFGATNYYKDIIYNKSQYVYWMDHEAGYLTSSADATAQGTIFLDAGNLPKNYSFTNGADGNQPTTGQKMTAWEKHFSSPDNLDISLMISGTSQADNGSGTAVASRAEATSYYNQLMDIAQDRKDCMVFFSPPKAEVVEPATPAAQNILNWTDGYTALNDGNPTLGTLNATSYATLDSAWLYIYDRYNDRYVYVPANGHTAGLCARTDYTNDAWWSPAGYNRGQIFGVTKLAFNPTKTDRDNLYRRKVNPIVTFPGQGTMLFGDKTLVANDGSAFSRINVRRLFIVLEKAISLSAKFQLFEFNDSFTRANFRSSIEPFLRAVQGRRGIYDYRVICDESNNTPAVIDSNQFVAAIFVKPARSINFITLTFVASRSGVDFEEVYGAAGIGAAESPV